MKKLCMLLICISLFPFISSFGTLIGESNGNTTNLSYVPYFGATGNISVGIYNLTSGGLFPTTTLLYDIGTGANRWRWLYVQNISADSIDVVGNVTASGYLLGDGGFLTGVNVTDIWVDETGDTMTGALNIKNSLNIFGNYPFKFWDNGGVNQYSYMMGNADEFRFSAVGNQMNFYYGALGSNLASSMDTSGNWNFTKNVEIFGDLNVTSDTWCNQTNCYNFSDFLTGGGISRWLNTSDYLYINSSYPQHINISGNATFGGGAKFKGAILGDESLGYENIRFGVYAHTPRIIFDNGTTIGQIDYVGDTIRFILNETGVGNRATMRINNSAVRIGEAGHRRDLYLYGDLIGVDPAGGGANIKIDGKINITTDTWCNRDNCYNLSNFLGNSSFNGTFVSDNYVPYTGATSNVVLGAHNFSVNTDNLFVNKENGNVGIGTTTPDTKLQIDGNFTSETNATDSIGTNLIQWLNGFFVNLFVSNDLDVGGDLNVTGYLNGKNYVTQYHRNASIDTGSADTWVNVTWDLQIAEETTSGYSLADSNISITIENTGIYRVQGCLHPKNNGVGNQEASLYSRVLINGVEAKCLQFANSKEFKTTGIDTMPFTGTLYAETGQKVQLQYYVTSTNIDFEGASVFDDGVAGSINFERISK